MIKNSYTNEDLNQDCRLCSLPDTERIIYKNSNYILMLSLGPIEKGYSLIIPQRHISCYGNLSQDLIEEFIQMKERIRITFFTNYKTTKVVFFEHGNVGSSICKLPSDNHAHLHCVPMFSEYSMVELIKREIGIEPITYDSVGDFIKEYQLSEEKKHYLLVEENNICNIFFCRWSYNRKSVFKKKISKSL